MGCWLYADMVMIRMLKKSKVFFISDRIEGVNLGINLKMGARDCRSFGVRWNNMVSVFSFPGLQGFQGSVCRVQCFRNFGVSISCFYMHDLSMISPESEITNLKSRFPNQ